MSGKAIVRPQLTGHWWVTSRVGRFRPCGTLHRNSITSAAASSATDLNRLLAEKLEAVCMVKKLDHERAYLREKVQRRGIENRATDARSDDFEFERIYVEPISPDSKEDAHLYELGKAFHFLKDNRFLCASAEELEELDKLPQKKMSHKKIMKLAELMRAEMAQGNDEDAKSKCRSLFFERYYRRQQHLQGRGVRFLCDDLPKWLQGEICAAGGYANWFEVWSYATQHAQSQ